MPGTTTQASAALHTALAEVGTWDDERLVGQLFSLAVGTHSARGIAFEADAQTENKVQAIADVVRRRHVGGVCYFPVTAEGDPPAEIRSLVQALQAAAELPLVVSTDQENGTVSRLRQGSTRIPSAMALAATGDLGLVEEVAAMSGEELRAAGITHAFAPVADMNTEPRNPVIGVRSPGASPERLAAQVRATVRGLRRSGVASTLKHFPGHGSTEVDSHLGLPVLSMTRDEWVATERTGFAAGIDEGVDAVMIGHLVFPAVDPSAPATFSRAVVTGELRERLGFDGVIVTDALDMAGARLPGGPGAACVAALAAGVDQVLMPGEPESSIEAVVAAVRSGELSREALRESARRILRLKISLGLDGDGVDADAELATPEHLALASEAAGRSLTWRDSATTWALPSATQPLRVLVVGHTSDPELRGVDVAAVLASALSEQGTEVSRAEWSDPVGPESAGAHDVVLLASRDAWRTPEAAARLEAWLGSARSSGVAAVVVATRSPSDSALVPDDVPVLLMFGDVAPSAAAAAAVLSGGAAASGVLPVDLLDVTGAVRWHHTPAVSSVAAPGLPTDTSSADAPPSDAAAPSDAAPLDAAPFHTAGDTQ